MGYRQMASPRFLVSIFGGSSPSTPESKGYNMTYTLFKYEYRNTYGKNYNRRLRSHNLIPAVIYSKENTSKHIVLRAKHVLKEKIFINMPTQLQPSKELNNTSLTAIVKDLQIDVIKRTIIHIDFLEIKEEFSLQLKIPFNFKNLERYKVSGRMNMVNKYLSISCNSKHIPRYINVDMLELAQQKKRVLVQDIKQFIPKDISIINKDHELISIFK